MSLSTRFLCIDVGDADDAVAASAVTRAVALSGHWGRLLCFGRAASVAAQLDRQERLEREDMWLDHAATWLLADDNRETGRRGSDREQAPPARPQPGPIQSAAVAIGRSGHDVGALSVVENVVEIVGNLLVMVVAHPDAIDAVDNAHFWVVGGAPWEVKSVPGGRAICQVGGRIVGVTVERQEATIEAWPLKDGTSTVEKVSLVPPPKLSVRSNS